MAAFNPLLAESELAHQVAVDRLKWELGQPLPWLSPPPPLYNPRYYYYYDYYNYYPYGYPCGPAVSNQYHYSMGFRDGLQQSGSGAGSSGRSGASSPGGGRRLCESPTTTTTTRPEPAAKSSASTPTAAFPGDLMGFPSGSYRRALCPFPVSTDTSYDDLAAVAWPYGCKPFYFRHADPPSVRYC